MAALTHLYELRKCRRSRHASERCCPRAGEGTCVSSKLLYLCKNKEVAQPNQHITSIDNAKYDGETVSVDSIMSTINQVIVFA